MRCRWCASMARSPRRCWSRSALFPRSPRPGCCGSDLTASNHKKANSSFREVRIDALLVVRAHVWVERQAGASRLDFFSRVLAVQNFLLHSIVRTSLDTSYRGGLKLRATIGESKVGRPSGMSQRPTVLYRVRSGVRALAGNLNFLTFE